MAQNPNDDRRFNNTLEPYFRFKTAANPTCNEEMNDLGRVAEMIAWAIDNIVEDQSFKVPFLFFKMIFSRNSINVSGTSSSTVFRNSWDDG